MGIRLIDGSSDSTARRYVLTSVFWLVLALAVGLVTAIQLVWPDLTRGIPQLQFGRLRAAYLNAAVLGWLSLAGLGAAHYIVPRLTGRPLWSERLGNWGVWLWNGALLTGVTGLLHGWTEGREYAELAWPFDLLLLAAAGLAGCNLLATVARRAEDELYVSVWYVVGAVVWFPVIYVVGNRTFVRVWGLHDAIVNSFYAQGLVGLWLTALALAAAYHLVPVLTERALYGRRLALVGFWGLALLYPFTGGVHLLQAPVPEWLKGMGVVASALLLVPVSAVVTNLFVTLSGRWDRVYRDIALRWVVTGGFHFLMAGALGAFQATRWVNWYLQYSQWMVAYHHLVLWGAFSFIALGALYHAVPRLLARPWFSGGLAEAHFWLTLAGFTLTFWSLAAAGLVQSAAWLSGSPVQQVVPYLKPHFVAAVSGAAAMALGQSLFAYNLYLTARARVERAPAEPAAAPAAFVPAGGGPGAA